MSSVNDKLMGDPYSIVDGRGIRIGRSRLHEWEVGGGQGDVFIKLLGFWQNNFNSKNSWYLFYFFINLYLYF